MQVWSTTARTQGTITATDTSQQMLPANAKRMGIEIFNYGSNPVTLSFGGTAVFGTWTAVAAGGTFNFYPELVDVGSINVICDTGDTSILWYVEHLNQG